jgi:hypothetical protein
MSAMQELLHDRYAEATTSIAETVSLSILPLPLRDLNRHHDGDNIG